MYYSNVSLFVLSLFKSTHWLPCGLSLQDKIIYFLWASVSCLIIRIFSVSQIVQNSTLRYIFSQRAPNVSVEQGNFYPHNIRCSFHVPSSMSMFWNPTGNCAGFEKHQLRVEVGRKFRIHHHGKFGLVWNFIVVLGSESFSTDWKTNSHLMSAVLATNVPLVSLQTSCRRWWWQKPDVFDKILEHL